MKPNRRRIWAALAILLALFFFFVPIAFIHLQIVLTCICLSAAIVIARDVWIRVVASLLLALGLLILVPVFVFAKREYVSASAAAPDQSVIAEIYELNSFIDRNFQLRLKRSVMGFIPRRTVLFRSGDEGAPGKERILWSRNGRHLLIVGKNLYPQNKICLSTGEWLYAVYDRQEDGLRVNAQVLRNDVRFESYFSLDEIAGIDFGERLTESDEPRVCPTRRNR